MTVLNDLLKAQKKQNRKVIKVRLPKVRFVVDDYNTHVNVWHFLGWLSTFLLVVWCTVLAFMLLLFWSHCLSNGLHGTTNKAQDAVKARYVRDCENNHGVPNTGSSDSGMWECTKL